MTIFLVSLFLPYTVHIDVGRVRKAHRLLGSTSRSPSQILNGDYGSSPVPTSVTGSDRFPLCPNVRSQAISRPKVDSGEPWQPPEYLLHSNCTCAMRIAGVEFVNSNDLQTTESELESELIQSKEHDGTLSDSNLLVDSTKSVWLRNSTARLSTSLRKSHELNYEKSLLPLGWTILPSKIGNHRLYAAINAACKADSTLKTTWVGTFDVPIDVLNSQCHDDVYIKLKAEYDCLTVFPTATEFDGHYSHYCQNILWPAFHNQIPNNSQDKIYQDRSWVSYVRVNQLFADTIAKNYSRGDVIWVHDYHLLLVPLMIRKIIPEAEIGFYLHVPFPLPEVFRCLATREDLLNGLLGADLIGFQTKEYCAHFLQISKILLNVEVKNQGVKLGHRLVNISMFPTGVDLEKLDARRSDRAVQEWNVKLQKNYDGKCLIVAFDKSSHTHDIRQKLLSYELFLRKYPQHRDKAVLVLVATPTNERSGLDHTVSDTVTRINAHYSTLTHQPLIFLERDMEYPEYLALLSSADVLLTTGLYEGLDLISHEFLFCQDGSVGEKKHGSLILNEFIGDAINLCDHELSVNPWDYHQCAEAIRKALEMPCAEKAQRWERSISTVKHFCGSCWTKTYLQALRDNWNQRSR